MELPALTSIEGAYWYLISIIVAIAVAFGVYVVAAALGLAPDPSGLVDGVPFLAPADAVRVASDAARATSTPG